MYSDSEKKEFNNIAESLKKYRRAELTDNENQKDILDYLYVDLLPENHVLNKCLLDNTTFLIGRKGTGKSTIFLKMEHEYRKKQTHFPCYIDVKTVFESSKSLVTNTQYLEEYLNPAELKKYLIGRTFIQNMLSYIYEEIDNQKENFIKKILSSLSGNDKQKIKSMIGEMKKKIDSNDNFKKVEVPILTQRKLSNNNLNKSTQQTSTDIEANLSFSQTDALNAGYSSNDCYEQQEDINIEYSDMLLKVFDIQAIIKELKKVLNLMKINKLIVMLDDVSEIDNDALRLFMDTIVAPLNNWSDDFIKFKIAFYPGRVHYGNIDPSKIDIMNLDFYNLYSTFDTNKMEINAIDFTKRLLLNRFNYYLPHNNWKKYFDEKLSEEDIATLFFQTSINVPRIIGYQLSYIYENVILYGKKITKQDIENSAIRYYENNVSAFFDKSTYCLLSIEEQQDINQLKLIRNAIVNQSNNIKQQITRGELKGKIYDKKTPYTSHFHILHEFEKCIESLELNHFISKYDEKSNKDGKKVSIYCLNYGLAKKNNIFWGKPSGSEYRKYFIERPFNFTSLILNQINANTIIKCTSCGRVFSEEDIPHLEFCNYKCPNCTGLVKKQYVIDKKINDSITETQELKKLSKEEMNIILQLGQSSKTLKARDLASELDMNSRSIAYICKKMDLERKLVIRNKIGTIYEYSLTIKGKQYYLK